MESTGVVEISEFIKTKAVCLSVCLMLPPVHHCSKHQRRLCLQAGDEGHRGCSVEVLSHPIFAAVLKFVTSAWQLLLALLGRIAVLSLVG